VREGPVLEQQARANRRLLTLDTLKLIMTRRDLAKAALTALSASRVLGANERVRIAVLGAGGRGTYVMNQMRKTDRIDVVALSDVSGPRLQAVKTQSAPQADLFRDWRAILDRKDVDAVIIGSPDHWHVPMLTAAVAAGKDAYCEKPLTHSVEEGQRIIEAVEKSGRIVQVGYQQRSYPHFAEAKRLIAEGKIGTVTQVRTWWFQNYLNRTPTRIAEDLDWKQWLGPAPYRPYDIRRHDSWRFYWDYGGGAFTDLFSHWVDSVHWLLDDSVPNEVTATGSKFAIPYWDCPDTVAASLYYPKKTNVIYEGTMVQRYDDGGLMFRGTAGTMRLTRDGFSVWTENSITEKKTNNPPPDLTMKAERDGTYDHAINFLDSVRDRKQPNSDVRSAVDGANAAHFANRAYLTGETIRPSQTPGAWRPLFDGRSLDGWRDPSRNVWRVRDNMIVGRAVNLAQNEFLRHNAEFGDFELRVEFRLIGGTGNSGIQFRSAPAELANEVTGYQADIGEKFWGCLYDESRRNKVLEGPDPQAIASLDKTAWHEYVIRAEGRHITLKLGGIRTVYYREDDPAIPRRGFIALQAHSGPALEVWFRKVEIREL
jgi:predicted dehydrogenase